MGAGLSHADPARAAWGVPAGWRERNIHRKKRRGEAVEWLKKTKIEAEVGNRNKGAVTGGRSEEGNRAADTERLMQEKMKGKDIGERKMVGKQKEREREQGGVGKGAADGKKTE
ncbi:Hypothetical predicted protein [Xyrichtys novacula]|uniref:Uncharacterized protein n=1 Tax=Xyrichtys novacula TaxID=13765 RepID=A0AAV1ENJ2_XYRNO|nr:Hypothetical predicted protein [Xyrichtys novacula]